MLAIEVGGSALDAERVCERVQVWLGADEPGWGREPARAAPPLPRANRARPESLCGSPSGIEDVEDLWRDLDHALRA
jgi:hypothetical protein